MAESSRLESLDSSTDHRFAPVRYFDANWDLAHLGSFAFKADIGIEVTVVVIFSCHCFTRRFQWDPRPRARIPECEIYRDAREERVLDPVRYELSRTLLPEVIATLPQRHIVVANAGTSNFLTWEVRPPEGGEIVYAVFFEVAKDKRRNRILRIQSAYPMEAGLTARQKRAKRVRLPTLLKAAYEGRIIRA